jgi:hypothetical protein
LEFPGFAPQETLLAFAHALPRQPKAYTFLAASSLINSAIRDVQPV